MVHQKKSHTSVKKRFFSEVLINKQHKFCLLRWMSICFTNGQALPLPPSDMWGEHCHCDLCVPVLTSTPSYYNLNLLLRWTSSLHLGTAQCSVGRKGKRGGRGRGEEGGDGRSFSIRNGIVSSHTFNDLMTVQSTIHCCTAFQTHFMLWFCMRNAVSIVYHHHLYTSCTQQV